VEGYIGIDRNSQQGDFGEAWLEVVAAGAGLLHCRGTTLDREKADVELVFPGKLGNASYPTVKAQVKTTNGLRTTANGDQTYDLDADAYNVLVRTDHTVRRILVVFDTSQAELYRVTHEGTLLLGKGLWVSLEGLPESANTSTVAVTLPISNTLDRVGLERMIAAYGIRMTTNTAEPNVWGES
jgi:hypothetical protein